VILLTIHDDDAYVMEGRRLGALGFVLKSEAGAELLSAVEAAASGMTYLSPRLSSNVVEALAAGLEPVAHHLTDREREVLQLISEGQTTKEVASTLGYQREDRGDPPHEHHAQARRTRDRRARPLRDPAGPDSSLTVTSAHSGLHPMCEGRSAAYVVGGQPRRLGPHRWEVRKNFPSRRRDEDPQALPSGRPTRASARERNVGRAEWQYRTRFRTFAPRPSPHVQTIGRPEDVMQRKSSFNAFVDAGGGVSTVAHPRSECTSRSSSRCGPEIVARDRSGRIHLRQQLDMMGWVHLPELRIDFVFRRQEQDKQDPADRWATANHRAARFRLPIPAQTLDRTTRRGEISGWMTSDPGRQPPWLHYYAGACEQHILTFSRPVHGRATLDVSCRCHEEENETKVDVWGNVAFERSTSLRVHAEGWESRPGTSAD
jgi:hypothetical protein